MNKAITNIAFAHIGKSILNAFESICQQMTDLTIENKFSDILKRTIYSI